MLINRLESFGNMATYGQSPITRCFYTTTVPSGTISSGDLWFESTTSVKYPLPWIYDSSLGFWFSQPFDFVFSFTASATGNFQSRGLELIGSYTAQSHILRGINGLITTLGTNNSTNYWTLAVKSYNVQTFGSDTIYNLATDTYKEDGVTNVQPINSTRRVNNYPSNTYLMGNHQSILITATKVGAPTNIDVALRVILAAKRA